MSGKEWLAVFLFSSAIGESSEGVETQEEMEQISSWGVEMIQGYYFSKPLPEKELLELLKKQDNIER